MQLAKHVFKASKVIAIAGSDEKCQWLKKIGADHALYVRRTSFVRELPYMTIDSLGTIKHLHSQMHWLRLQDLHMPIVISTMLVVPFSMLVFLQSNEMVASLRVVPSVATIMIPARWL